MAGNPFLALVFVSFGLGMLNRALTVCCSNAGNGGSGGNGGSVQVSTTDPRLLVYCEVDAAKGRAGAGGKGGRGGRSGNVPSPSYTAPLVNAPQSRTRFVQVMAALEAVAEVEVKAGVCAPS